MTKICSKCNIEKSYNYFNKNTKNRDGHSGKCKSCLIDYKKQYYIKNKKFVDEKNSEWFKTNPDKTSLIKRRHVLKKYGLTIKEYDEMVKSRNNKCDICFNSEKGKNISDSLCVDHCHKTGKIRGLLCRNCNSALGQFKDSLDNLQSAMLYLEKGE